MRSLLFKTGFAAERKRVRALPVGKAVDRGHNLEEMSVSNILGTKDGELHLSSSREGASGYKRMRIPGLRNQTYRG